jgi:hypothetical protein
MSVNRKVTVPVGGLLTLSASPLALQEDTIAAGFTTGSYSPECVEEEFSELHIH